jgi:hypothetical protein
MQSSQIAINEQNEQIDEIRDVVKRIKNNSTLINNELDHQTMY